MENRELNCSENELITCPVCKVKIDKKYLGERCPRCNSVIMPKSCEHCKNTCK